MKRELLNKIGQMFTLNWVEKQNNTQLQGFDRSAEQCLQEAQAYKVGACVSWGFVMMGIILIFIDSLWGGTSVIVFGIGVMVINKKIYKRGATSGKIIKGWKPLRKKLLKYGVISRIQKILKQKFPGRNFVPQDEVRNLLVRGIDERMSILSSKLIEAQREQMSEKKIQKLLGHMIELEKLARDLGLNMDFDPYFTPKAPKRKETVRVTLRFGER